MSTTGEIIRKLVLAYSKKDGNSFVSAIEEYISEERKKNHYVLAKDIEKILRNNLSSFSDVSNSFTLLGQLSSDLPRDKERGSLLVEISEPRRELESVFLKESSLAIVHKVICENRSQEILRTYGLKPSSKLLFCGPPGCGKTVTAEALAHSLYLPLVLVRVDSVVSSFLGETAANLRKVFDFARSRSMVVLFDEFDAIGKHRTAEEEHGELKRVVNSFLQMLDNFAGDTILIAATNHQGLLDPALWRRFDEIVFFDLPNESEILTLMTKSFQQVGLSQAVDLNSIAKDLVGMSHADVERIGFDAIKQTVLNEDAVVSSEVLEDSIKRQRNRIEITQRNLTT